MTLAGRRFGALVHSMLAAVDLNCTRAEIDSAADLHGRLVDATQEEIDAAATTVVDALSHPLMRTERSPKAWSTSLFWKEDRIFPAGRWWTSRPIWNSNRHAMNIQPRLLSMCKPSRRQQTQQQGEFSSSSNFVLSGLAARVS